MKNNIKILLFCLILGACSHSPKNKNHVITQINDFLDNQADQFGLFENNRILESVELRTKRHSKDLVYRITSNQCAVELKIADSKTYTVENFNCDGKSPKTSLKTSLYFAKDLKEFKAHLHNEFELQLFMDEEVVMIALDVLEAQQKTGNKKALLARLDEVYNQLFAQINPLTVKVKNGKFPDDKFFHYKLEGFSFETVSRYERLSKKLL